MSKVTGGWTGELASWYWMGKRTKRRRDSFRRGSSPGGVLSMIEKWQDVAY